MLNPHPAPPESPMSAPFTFPTALDIMTIAPAVVGRETPILQVAELLIRRRVTNVCVVETECNEPVLAGFVSEADLVQAFACGLIYRLPDAKVSEIMRIHPVSVRGETGVVELAAIFAEH